MIYSNEVRKEVKTHTQLWVFLVPMTPRVEENLCDVDWCGGSNRAEFVMAVQMFGEGTRVVGCHLFPPMDVTWFAFLHIITVHIAQRVTGVMLLMYVFFGNESFVRIQKTRGVPRSKTGGVLKDDETRGTRMIDRAHTLVYASSPTGGNHLQVNKPQNASEKNESRVSSHEWQLAADATRLTPAEANASVVFFWQDRNKRSVCINQSFHGFFSREPT